MIESATERLMDLLEKRLGALRLLAKDMVEGREALITMDAEAVLEHSSLQDSLCAQVRQLDGELVKLMRELNADPDSETREVSLGALAAQLSAVDGERLQTLLHELEVARTEVRRLNTVLTEFLRRSRYSLNVLSNLVASCTGTYAPPNTAGRAAL